MDALAVEAGVLPPVGAPPVLELPQAVNNRESPTITLVNKMESETRPLDILGEKDAMKVTSSGAKNVLHRANVV